MPTLAVANLRNVAVGPAIVEYLERIDATLRPYRGGFLVHGAPVEVLEGRWSGDLIVLWFPDRESALGWYHSEAYRAILPLRTTHAEGDVVLVDTVPDDHRATDILADLACATREG